MERSLPRLPLSLAGLWITLCGVLLSFAAMAQRPFVTTWKTDNPGEAIIIPVNPDVSGYNFTVDWGDGSTSTGQTSDADHTYASPGTYTVSISGNFPAIRLQSVDNEITDKLMSIEQWGDIAWASMYGAFSGAKNMVLNAADAPNLSGVSSLSRMFMGAEAFNGDLSGWNVSSITDMSSMFYSAFAFNGNISNWNVSNVTNMHGMFWQASVFNQDIGGWNVGNVEDMSFMFYQAPVFNQDLSNWDVSRVTTMNSMFFIALAFDRSLGNWDISSVTDMDDMLLSTGLSPANYGTTLIGWAALPTVPSNITLDATGLEYCPGTAAETARQELQMKEWNIIGDHPAVDCDGGAVITPGDPGNFVTTWLIDSDGTIIIPTHPDETYNYNIYWENTTNSAQNGMLAGQTGDVTLTLPPGGIYRVEINGDFPRIFINDGADKNQIRSVEQWGNISWTSMERAFFKAYYLQLHATDAPDLSRVTSLREMFYGAEQLNAPVGHWDVSTITDMHGLFRDAELFNQDLSNWDVSNVTDMAYMFFWNTDFNGNITNWDVSAVKTMRNMFGLCRSFNQDISGWDVGQVEHMEFMFSGAWAFNQDIRGWDVSNVEDMQNLLHEARAFDHSLGDWDITSVSNMVDMLNESGLSLANYDATLQGWASQANIPQNVSLGAKDLTFCAAAEARQALIDEYGWEITGDSPACASMLLFIETDAGNTVIILTEGSDSIQQVKQKIQDKAGFLPDQQQLFFEGSELEDGRTLTDYGIVNGNTLQLTLHIQIITPSDDNIVYVDGNVDIDAPGYTGAGDSWGNALQYLSDATKAAITNDDIKEIRVAAGTYYPTGEQNGTNRDSTFAILRGGLKIVGGFPNGGGPRDIATNKTILSGNINDEESHEDNSYHVLVIAGIDAAADSIVIDGFTIQHGYANGGNLARRFFNGRHIRGEYGGGIYITFVETSGKTLIRHCVITENHADGRAGGLTSIASSIRIEDCEVNKNSGASGGGVNFSDVSGINIQIERTHIIDNTASTIGGGLFSNQDSVICTNCVIAGNRSPKGGGVSTIFGGYVKLINSVISGNHATESGGGMWSGYSSVIHLVNTTVSGNRADVSGGGLYVETNAKPMVFNSIIYGNDSGIIDDGAATLDLSHSLIQGVAGNQESGILDGTADYRLFKNAPNPLLAPFLEGDYQLLASSIVINAGDNSHLPAGVVEDLAGNPRIYDGFAVNDLVDLGAFEYQGEPGPVYAPNHNNILHVDINVDTDALGYTGSGDSWENAIPELADALRWAREQHDGGDPDWNETDPLRIFVAKGTYKPLYNAADEHYTTDGGRDNSFVLVPDVQLYGGFDPSAGIEALDDARILPDINNLAQGSILSGDFNGNDHTDNFDNHTENAYHVTIVAGEVGSARIDGFTIAGGNANSSGGVTVFGRGIRKEYGGGTVVITSSPQLTHMAWSTNFGLGGGGLFNSVNDLTEESSPKLTRVSFFGNAAPFGGGGIWNYNGYIEIIGAVFAGNGAGHETDGTSSGPGGAIYSTRNNNEKSLAVTNATFYGNRIVGVFFPSWDGAAIHVDGSTATLTNVIAWGNEVEGDATATSASMSVSDGEATVANSLMANLGGSGNWNSTVIMDGGNNVDANPLFVSTTPGEAGYLQLSACSPAISVGDSQAYTNAGGDLVNDLDLAGNPRVHDLAGGGVIDMGAYEYQGERVFVQSLTMPDAVSVAYGTAMEDVEGLPTSVTSTLSDDRDVPIPLDGNLANWTLVSPAGGAFDGDVAGTYVFSVPLLIPETECYLNTENLAAEVTVIVTKGTPVLAASWSGTSIDATEGLSLTYGDSGELVISTTDPDGELTYGFGNDDLPVLDMTDMATVAARQAGTATLTIEQEESDNFEAASVEIVVTVTPKAITVVPTAGQGRVYGAMDPATYGYELAEGDALGFDDELTDIVSAASREGGVDVGHYDIELEFAGERANNYAVTFEMDNNAFMVTPLAIAVTAEDKSKVFGSDDPALTYTFAPELVGDDEFTGVLDREDGEDVGDYAITQGNLSLGTNYEINFEGGTLTIHAAGFDGITFNDLTVPYDGTEHVLALTGELPEGVAVTYAIDGAAGNGATAAGAYEVTALIDGGNNYEDAELTATLTITPLEITVVADDKSKVFGSDDPALTYTFAPELVGDDKFTGVLDREDGEDVGDYAITQGNLSLGTNYEINFEGGTLTIHAEGFDGITFNDLTVPYDGSEHVLALTGELPEGVTVTYAIDGAAGNGATAAGAYEVTALIDGGNNYEDAELTATLTITPLEITVLADDKSKVFGSDDPALTYTFAPELVGDDKFTGALTREDGEDVGEYAITQGNLALSDNYTLVFEPASLAITQRQIKGIDFKSTSFTYDGTEHRLTLASDLPAGASVTYENNRRTHVGVQEVTATIRGSGYETRELKATLTVLPAARTLDFPSLPEKTYGDAGFNAEATASSGESISYTSSNPEVAKVTATGEITIIGAGETSITATVPVNANYSSRPQVSRKLIVRKASQNITLGGPAEVDRDAGSIGLTVSSTSELPVVLTVDNAEVATLEGTTLNILRLGRVTITATQVGDANHEAAEPVMLAIRVIDPMSNLPVRIHPVISPNGDGINEFLLIEAIEDYPENRVTIFNRNGTLLWEASGYDNNRTAFRGISTGQQLLPAGTYFYIVEVKDGDTWEHRKGYLVLRY